MIKFETFNKNPQRLGNAKKTRGVKYETNR